MIVFRGGVLTANPPPINGTYAADQTVEFCYTLTDFDAVSANWLHAVLCRMEWDGLQRPQMLLLPHPQHVIPQVIGLGIPMVLVW